MQIEHVFPKQIIVIDDLPEQRFTGLLDHNGHQIFVTQHKNPIGFIWPKDMKYGQDV